MTVRKFKIWLQLRKDDFWIAHFGVRSTYPPFLILINYTHTFFFFFGEIRLVISRGSVKRDRGSLGSPNIFNFSFGLFKIFRIKRKFVYWLPLEFLLMGNHSQLMHILRKIMFNIGMMHILKEKMCRIGRLMLNSLS